MHQLDAGRPGSTKLLTRTRLLLQTFLSALLLATQLTLLVNSPILPSLVTSYEHSGTTSPARLTATYTDTYPVLPAMLMPPIRLSGTLTGSVMPAVANRATVITPGNLDPDNNTTTAFVTVAPALVLSEPPVVPDLSIVLTSSNGNTFTVGQLVVSNVLVCNGDSAGPILQPGLIFITGIIPNGLQNVTIEGSDWTLNSISSSTSPIAYMATYNGPGPVTPGSCLPPLVITGILTSSAVPHITSSATVSTPGNSPLANTSSVDTIFVITPTPTPTPTTAPTPTIAAVIPPDLAISLTHRGDNSFQTGQSLTYNLAVSNVGTAGPIVIPDPIALEEVIPLGLTHLTASGPGWHLTLSSPNSPTLLDATYTGPYPVQPGQTLSPITITGTLTPNAVSNLTSSATVSTRSDSDLSDNLASDTIPIAAAYYGVQEADQRDTALPIGTLPKEFRLFVLISWASSLLPKTIYSTQQAIYACTMYLSC